MNPHYTAAQQQEASDIDAERIQDNYRRAGVSSKSPSSYDLARRMIELTLDAAGHIPGTNDRAQAALGRISVRLAIAAENNEWVRKWLARESEYLARALRESCTAEAERS